MLAPHKAFRDSVQIGGVEGKLVGLPLGVLSFGAVLRCTRIAEVEWRSSCNRLQHQKCVIVRYRDIPAKSEKCDYLVDLQGDDACSCSRHEHGISV